MKRLAVIGYGGRMRHVLHEIERFNAGTEVVAVLDPAEDRLRQQFPDKLAGVTFYDDADTMLDQAAPDGVLIGTRCNLHTPYAIKVLERNLPLFLEKPVAIDWDQLRELADAVNKSESQGVVSFPLRLSPLTRTAREIVESGAIGTLSHVEAWNNVPNYGVVSYYHGWMRDESITGGLWLQKATHDLDYLTYLVGQTPAQVVAMETKNVFTGEMPAGLKCIDCPKQVECPESPYNLFYMQGLLENLNGDGPGWEHLKPEDWRCAFGVDTGNHDSASAMIRYESGLHLAYSQSFYSRRSAASRGCKLIGYQGTVTFDFYTHEVKVHYHLTGREESYQFPEVESGHGGGDMELAHDFIGLLNGARTSRASLEDGLLSAHICLMAKESCRTNAFQAFEPLNAPAAGVVG